MKCNQCESEMLKGYIPMYSGKLQWLPEEIKVPFWRGPKDKDTTVLSDTPAISPVTVTSYKCNTCNVIVVPIP